MSKKKEAKPTMHGFECSGCGLLYAVAGYPNDKDETPQYKRSCPRCGKDNVAADEKTDDLPPGNDTPGGNL